MCVCLSVQAIIRGLLFLKQIRFFMLAGSLSLLGGCQLLSQAPESTAEAPVKATPAPVITQAPQVITEPEVAVTDVWQRIRSQLNMPVPDEKLVRQYRQWYINNPRHLEQISERAAPFMYLIVEQIEERKLPMELALLPIVESAFDPFAYSHGAASGLWQFTAPMALHFGLEINWWYDGRRDVPAATAAALNMMEYLYDKTGENWLYAIAAYNTGEGRVLNAVKRNRQKGQATDFWSLSLPKETERYVPQLLALADVIKNADKYGINLTPIANEQKLEVVDVGSQIDLALAARLAGMEVNELQQFNPGFNRWATAPEGPHKLVLPLDKAKEFEIALASTEPSERLNWLRYKIRKGDSLGVIAKKHHTSIDVIRSVNGISGNNIVAGKHLLIPVALKDASAYPLSKEQRLGQNKSGKSKRSYQVKSGDSLWQIAKDNGVSVNELVKWNGISAKTPLRPGKQLTIWTKASGKSQNANAVMRTVKYKVRSGDSLARIASKFNVTVDDLLEWNQLKASKYLQPGQMLTLFVDVTRVKT
ncbi:lytic transglycosylase [Shewanella algae]|nr:LysM peptidoglycan-binding domain-containing protein [Shewanella algae]QTE79962.1 LysM peptidoglycan-binding domain-containing protein [Shewanella algae]TVK95189.1 lytic transglycosylase [Shewanella algae]